MQNVETKVTKDGYPVSDAVMRGGILLACHHGLDEAQIDYMHETFEGFAKSRLSTPISEAANA